MDIQFNGEISMILNRYITGYISKPERKCTADAWNLVDKNKTIKGQLKSFALQSFKGRECGIYEVFDKIFGYPMYEFSTEVVWLSTYPSEKRRKIVKNITDIKDLKADDNLLMKTNVTDDYYPNRPDELDHMSLWEFVAMYTWKKTKCNQKHTECVSLKNNLGFMHKRTESRIVNTSRIKCRDEKTTEAYFHQLLFLFYPWRDECDLYMNKTTYFEAYEFMLQKAADGEIICDLTNLKAYDQRKKDHEIAIEKAKEYGKKAREFKKKEEINHNATSTEQLGVIDHFIPEIDLKILNDKICKLNKEQKVAFDKVIDCINHLEAHKNKKCHCHNNLQPLKLFCSGVAGTIYNFLFWRHSFF